MTARVAIVGAGFSGIGLAITLTRAGIGGVVVYERGARAGGVWRDNAYPGAACDAPSHLYSFSFAPKPDWSRRFAPQPEILAYLEACATRFGVARSIRLGTAVRAAAWAGDRWRLTLGDGSVEEARVLVLAGGQLNEPAWPALPGAERFAGPILHTAAWPEGHDAAWFADRRVVVVGTGASAIQVVPAIARHARHVTVLQRSAPWVVPKPDRRYGAGRRALYRGLPVAQRAARATAWALFEAHAPGFAGHRAVLAPLEVSAVALRRAHLRDAALRERARPRDELGCKRVLLSSDWYRTLARPEVELVAAGLSGVTRHGVRTTDDLQRSADVLVLATGFAASTFPLTVDVTGPGGRLADTWAGGATAYRGISVPGFPSLFLLYGPNTNLGTGSIITMLESQMHHVLDAVRRLDRSGAAGIEVRAAAHRRERAWLEGRLARSVWQSGCTSWYLDAGGRDTRNWPGTMLRYRRLTRRLDPADYRLLPPVGST